MAYRTRWAVPAAAAVAVTLFAGCTPYQPPADPGRGSRASSPSGAPGSPTAPSRAPTTPGSAGQHGGGTAMSGWSGSREGHPDLTVSVQRTIATGLVSPWGLAFLTDPATGQWRAVVGERDTGRIIEVDTGRVLGTVPGVRPAGEGGLLGLAADPKRPGVLFAYFTGSRDNRVVELRLGSKLKVRRVLLSGIPKGFIHNGGRLAVRKGWLYVGTGEAGNPPLAQSGSKGGRIWRIRISTGRASVVSRGHRNVQGLAFDAGGRLWASEFGQNQFDELNRIRRGRNYGWPRFEGDAGGSGYVRPQATWPTDQASPSGIAVISAAGAEWVLMAGLRGRRLWAIPISAGRVSGPPAAFLIGELGRLRTVAVAPDGGIWLITSNTDGRGDPGPQDDRILQLAVTPAN